MRVLFHKLLFVFGRTKRFHAFWRLRRPNMCSLAKQRRCQILNEKMRARFRLAVARAPPTPPPYKKAFARDRRSSPVAFKTLDYSPHIDRSSLCYGSHEANRAQIDRRQGAAQAARHEGRAQIGARNRRRQEGEKTFNARKNSAQTF